MNNFLRQGGATTPSGGNPLDPCEHLTHRLSFPQFKMEWRPCIGVHKRGGGDPTPIFDWFIYLFILIVLFCFVLSSLSLFLFLFFLILFSFVLFCLPYQSIQVFPQCISSVSFFCVCLNGHMANRYSKACFFNFQKRLMNKSILFWV